jgi:hypothetical protein
MSWDVALVKIRGEFRPIEDVDNEDYVALGELDDVRQAIGRAFPSAKWSSPTWAVYEGPGFGIEFALDGVESSNSVILHVHGSGDPIPSLLRLTQANGWLAVDCSTGEFIDPNDPSYEGWEGFKSLVEGIGDDSAGE